MGPIWTRDVNIPERPPLPGDMEAEAAVIGGGLAGCLTAYCLREAGVNTVVLEAARIGSGQTAGTTAKVTSQHGLIYGRLIRQLGPELARMYAEANQRAIERYRALVREKGVDCDFEERPAYLYTRAAPAVLQAEWEAARRLGLPARLTTGTALPFPAAEALRFDGQAQLHPLKLLRAISEDLTVYERTPVRAVEGRTVYTDRGRVRAEHIVFACHFPFVNAPGYYFARMHQDRSYVLALEKAQALDGMYLGVDPGSLSFRQTGDVLLLGGAGHRTGDNAAGGRYDKLRRAARSFWPDSRELAHWSAQDCMPMDGVPYIGPYAKNRPGWYVATGFQKWGMTTSMAAAHILTDAILGRENDYAPVFSPQRRLTAPGVKAALSDGLRSAKEMGRQVFSFPAEGAEAMPGGHGGIAEHQGRKMGIYRDDDGGLHAVDTRCPHLGCQLSWNADERTWDCPCHGSRFDADGRRITGPAQRDIGL